MLRCDSCDYTKFQKSGEIWNDELTSCNSCSNKMYEEIPLTNLDQVSDLMKFKVLNKANSWFCHVFPQDQNNEIDINGTFVREIIYKFYNVFIASYDAWCYTQNLNDDRLNKFYGYPIEINKQIRNGNYSDISKHISSLIDKSYGIKSEITVYRGLDKKLDLTVGEIYTHKGFMFCSLSYSTAKYFSRNTQSYYDKKMLPSTKANGMVLKIKLKKNTKLLDFSNYHPALTSVIQTEVLLDTDLKFRVTNVEKDIVTMEQL